jgi:hypothetical protein
MRYFMQDWLKGIVVADVYCRLAKHFWCRRNLAVEGILTREGC